jgi:hypothetical protein
MDRLNVLVMMADEPRRVSVVYMTDPSGFHPTPLVIVQPEMTWRTAPSGSSTK